MRRFYRRPVLTSDNMNALRDAFKALRKAGYNARMNFSCCGSCGWYELGQSKKGADKVVFYHRQGAERLEQTGRTHLQWSGDATEIVSILRHNGVPVAEVPENDMKAIEIDFTLIAKRKEEEETAAAWAAAAELFG
jgi:hypothetical protein